MNALNPFVWSREIDDGVGRSSAAADVALILKGGTHIQLFGPRGTGKTTFTVELAGELGKNHGPEVPPWECLRVDLRPVASLGDFVTAVRDAVQRHPSHTLRRRIQGELSGLEKDLGINLGVIKVGIKSPIRQEDLQAILSSQLRALRTLDTRLVIIFDEFQRLANCSGDPLAVIRSSLMSADGGQETSLLFTGSFELPQISHEDFAGYLELRFEATSKPIDSRATDHLLVLSELHPKRTQQLAWMVWQTVPENTLVRVEHVAEAFEQLVEDKDAPGRDFAVTYDYWLNGNASDVNLARALLLLANGLSPGSPADTKQVGIEHHQTAINSLRRLEERGYVERRDTSWHIVDPLFKEFLRRQPDGR
ncbi:MAG: AAA family ATPase [Solirubrobacterales bacterium]|nr:AAA family ATPase [Solirubrobacterales bacterium]